MEDSTGRVPVLVSKCAPPSLHCGQLLALASFAAQCRRGRKRSIADIERRLRPMRFDVNDPLWPSSENCLRTPVSAYGPISLRCLNAV